MIYRKIDISQAAFYNVSEDAAKEFIDHRANKGSKTTQRAFERSLKKAVECERYGFTPDEAIEETIEAGWVAVTPEFLAARQSRKMQAVQEARTIGSTRQTTIIEDLGDRSWAKH